MINLFGTDGIRGVFGKEISPGLVFEIGRAIAVFTKSINKNGKILIAKDTRTTASLLEFCLLSGILGEGINADTIGIASTPCVSFLTKKHGYTLGIMITASHNSPEYNGIKVFDTNGLKINYKEEKQIEKIVYNLDNISYESFDKIGKTENKDYLIESYISFLKNMIGTEKLSKKICFDCANGATGRILQKLFGSKFILTNVDKSGLNVNVNCGATNLSSIKNTVKTLDAEIGISFDGDGDRIMVVDKNLREYNGDDILYIFAKELKKEGKLKENKVIGTSMTNYGLEKALEKEGITLERVDVGDKNIIEKLKENALSLGGEPAGHIILGDELLSGDGVLTAIKLINILQKNDFNFDVLLKGLVKYPQIIKNIKVRDKAFVLHHFEVKKALELCESLLLKSGRIVLRPSGTEPVIRIMIEGENEKLIEELAAKIYDVIKSLN